MKRMKKFIMRVFKINVFNGCSFIHLIIKSIWRFVVFSITLNRYLPTFVTGHQIFISLIQIKLPTLSTYKKRIIPWFFFFFSISANREFLKSKQSYRFLDIKLCKHIQLFMDPIQRETPHLRAFQTSEK